MGQKVSTSSLRSMRWNAKCERRSAVCNFLLRSTAANKRMCDSCSIMTMSLFTFGARNNLAIRFRNKPENVFFFIYMIKNKYTVTNNSKQTAQTKETVSDLLTMNSLLACIMTRKFVVRKWYSTGRFLWRKKGTKDDTHCLVSIKCEQHQKLSLIANSPTYINN